MINHFCMILMGVVAFIQMGCESQPVNAPLITFNLDEGYRYEKLEPDNNSDDVFLVLAFSGGGTRAAALSYGVLEKLRDTPITINGQKRRLLDEVDVISSVSGGSFTAAYYTAFRERIFEDYKKRFLYPNIQGALVGGVLWPPNLIRTCLSGFTKSDFAVELYDERLFGGVTYEDLIADSRRPYLVINATDMSHGLPFQFTQGQFDLLSSDLSSMSLSRAVAASSAVPGLLTPITLRSFPETGVVPLPSWVTKMMTERETLSRNFRRAQQAHNYITNTQGPWIHLVDGGITDNLGIEGVRSMNSTREISSLGSLVNLNKIQHFVMIMVNAQAGRKADWNRSSNPPGIIDAALASLSGVMGNSSMQTAVGFTDAAHAAQYDTSAQVRDLFGDRAAEIDEDKINDVKFWVIDVSFNQIADKDRREYFQGLPSSFKLKKKDVDLLIEYGKESLSQSKQVSELIHALR